MEGHCCSAFEPAREVVGAQNHVLKDQSQHTETGMESFDDVLDQGLSRVGLKIQLTAERR